MPENNSQAIWTPSKLESLNMIKFQNYINKSNEYSIKDYQQLHQFSVNETALFWQSIVEFCNIDFVQPSTQIVKYGEHKIDTNWFVGGKLNYAGNILKHRSDKIAITFENEKGIKTSISYNKLYQQVAKLQHFLITQGIKKDDVVAGFLPNIIQTVIAMLATT